jgi:hypothetical protein
MEIVVVSGVRGGFDRSNNIESINLIIADLASLVTGDAMDDFPRCVFVLRVDFTSLPYTKKACRRNLI